MTTEPNANPPADGSAEPQLKPKLDKSALLQLPGLVAISLYMLLRAGVTIVSVVSGHAQPMNLIFPVFFIAGALGLLLLLRWAWALTLAAVVLFAGSSLWSFSLQHSPGLLVQGLLNLVFFLYLVRTAVRTKLR